MPPVRKSQDDPPAGAPGVPPPPFYEAASDLYVHDPESGTMPARAFAAGDRVPPELVAPNGWGPLVRVPAQFAGALPGPVPAATPADGPAA